MKAKVVLFKDSGKYYAINNNEKTGVWGGRSERARRAIRRRAFGGAA